jgi:hypothetical protein
MLMTLFQLNALTPLCSIDTFVLKYIKYIENDNNDGTPVEEQRTIDKRTMSLKVQFFFCCCCVNIRSNQ